MVSVPRITLKIQESITFLASCIRKYIPDAGCPQCQVSPGLKLLLSTATVLSHPLVKSRCLPAYYRLGLTRRSNRYDVSRALSKPSSLGTVDEYHNGSPFLAGTFFARRINGFNVQGIGFGRLKAQGILSQRCTSSRHIIPVDRKGRSLLLPLLRARCLLNRL
jgi:hypothetical protein